LTKKERQDVVGLKKEKSHSLEWLYLSTLKAF